MKKNILLAISLLTTLLSSAKVQEIPSCTLKASFGNYTRNSVEVSFMQTPEWNMTFPYNSQNPTNIDYTFEINKIEGVYVNGQLVYFEPGNELEIRLNYGEDGRNQNIDIISGNSPQTVLANELLQQMRQLRRKNRFKTQALTWVVIGTSLDEQFQKSKEQLNAETTLLNDKKSALTQSGYNYLLAETESLIYTNMINYPITLSGAKNIPIDSCLISEYSTFLKNYEVKSDAASLRNRNYCSFLVTLYTYNRLLEQLKRPIAERDKGQNAEEIFNGLVDYYTGDVRDATLFAFLYLSMSNNSTDFTVIEKLIGEYTRKYNINKEYKKELERVMQ